MKLFQLEKRIQQTLTNSKTSKVDKNFMSSHHIVIHIICRHPYLLEMLCLLEVSCEVLSLLGVLCLLEMLCLLKALFLFVMLCLLEAVPDPDLEITNGGAVIQTLR